MLERLSNFMVRHYKATASVLAILYIALVVWVVA